MPAFSNYAVFPPFSMTVKVLIKLSNKQTPSVKADHLTPSSLNTELSNATTPPRQLISGQMHKLCSRTLRLTRFNSQKAGV